MPCDSSYMEASGREIAMSHVCCLLDEIRTGKPVDNKSGEWNGYHPLVYCKGGLEDDALVAELCRHLTYTEVTRYSLEMQTWWRDHLRADEERIAREKQAAEVEREKEAGLAKLTPAQRKALGLK